MRFVYLYASPILRRDDRGEAVPMDLLNVTEEKAKLMQCFRDSAQDVSWSESVATRSTFLEMIGDREGCQLLHYTGHGTADGSLCFEESDSLYMHPIRGETLQEMFLSAQEGRLARVQCVFLSACFSETVAKYFVDAGVRNVIACESEVLDTASLDFTRTFYKTMLEGRSVKAAFDAAYAVAGASHVREHAAQRYKFKLLPEGLPHSEVLFPSTRTGVPHFPESDAPMFPMAAAQFVGRETDVQFLYDDITKHRVVAVRGTQGIGKTELIRKTVSLVCERRNINGVERAYECTCAMPGLSPWQCVFVALSLPPAAGIPETVALLNADSKNTVLVLDDADLPDVSVTEVLYIVDTLNSSCPKLRIVVAFRDMHDSWPHRERALGKVEPFVAAKMFVKWCPRDLNEFKLKVEGRRVFEVLAGTKVIAQLEGNPRLIQKVAKRVSTFTNLKWHGADDAFLSEVIPKCKKECFGTGELSGYVAAAGLPDELSLLFGDDAAAFVWTFSVVSQARNSHPSPEMLVSLPPSEYNTYLYFVPEFVQPHLEYVFEKEMPFLKARPLTDSDYHELIQGAEWGGKHVVDAGWMRPDQFVFWWQKIQKFKMALFHAKSDWCGPPIRLYGFLSRPQVEAALRDTPPGTYLFRFSNTNIGWFAVDFVKADGSTDKALIRATYPGVAYKTVEGTDCMYGSLAELRHQCLGTFREGVLL